MARHVEALAGEREIVRLRQPIDIKRMCPRGEIRSRPLRALLLGNYVSGRRRELIEAAWGEAGVEVVTVGAHGTPAPDPAGEIAAADIVVGKARAILDAMACGRAAYVLDVAGGDGWVTEERYAAMEADNFAGHTSDWGLDRRSRATSPATTRRWARSTATSCSPTTTPPTTRGRWWRCSAGSRRGPSRPPGRCARWRGSCACSGPRTRT